MSEAILKALMQLFALVVDIDELRDISDRERSIIRAFLKRQLSSELVEKYLGVFDEYLALYHQDRIAKGSLREKKRTSLTAVRILGICEKINEELEQRQKFYVIIQLIEYIAYGIDIREKELDFLDTVASAFNIPEEEYSNILNFVAYSLKDIPGKSQVLVVNSEPASPYKQVHHLRDPQLTGELSFLYIASVDYYVLRYHGTEDLFLNGQHLQTGTTYTFESGSSIRGQGIDPIYFSDISSVFSRHAIKQRLTFVARDVEFRFRNSENGIHDFNLEEESGNLVGIMGGSGVGKSTLLNVLNGILTPRSGKILINGYNLHDEGDKEKLNGVIGFIPQDDLLIEDLTVFQNLYYNARLCLDRYEEPEIVRIVDQVLEDLDLTAIRDLKVGKPLSKVISGGQRKRVNIGLELIREPSVLFVDEPTSGLSSVDSEMVMTLLKEQVKKGKLVIVNIHQPSSNLYKMFDKIIFMDKGGYQIFYGNPSEAVIYFKTRSNLANAREDQCVTCGNVDPDQVLQIIEAKIVNEHGKLSRTRKVTPKEWFSMFRESDILKKSPLPEKEELPENYYSIPNRLKQLKVFFTRDILSKLTNRQYVLISMLEAPLLAIILGFFTKYSKGTLQDPASYVFRFNENLPAFLLMSVIVFLFLGLTISSEEIIKDRKILQRESFLNLNRGSYLHAKIAIMFLISAIQSISYVLIGNLIFEIHGMTFAYWIILFSTACFANLLGLNISAGLNSVITIYILIPFLLIPQILFSGVLVKFDKLHRSLANYQVVPLIGDLMTSRWAYEALSVEQFKNNRFMQEFFEIEKRISDATYLESYLVPALGNVVEETRDVALAENGGDELSRNLELLENQCSFLGRHGFEPDFDPARIFNVSTFSASSLSQVDAWLDSVRQEALSRTREGRRLRNRKEQELMRELGGVANYTGFRNRYENAQLSDIVLNKKSLDDKVLRRGTLMVRTFEPAFMDPPLRNGRAHLYAPYKQLGSARIDTIWFNTMVIWLTALLLYITLRLDLLRRVLGYFEQIRIRRRSK